LTLQSGNDGDLLDDIYEAAFVPELWQRAIEGMGRMVAAQSGALLVFDEQKPISFSALEPSFDAMQNFLQGDNWRQNRRLQHWAGHPFTGFVVAQDYFPEDVLADDEPYQRLKLEGFDSQVGTIIPMPTGEVVAFLLDRKSNGLPFSAAELGRLNAVYPHLARASMLSARLGLERAEITLAALASVGLAAAAVSSAGVVVSVNAAFESVKELFSAAAFGRIGLGDAAANLLLQAALSAVQTATEPLVRTVPVAGTAETEPALVHVLPLRGAARDIFSRASAIIIAAPVRASSLVPAASILTGLFDLTPAEARLATALACGDTVAEYATRMHIAMPTVRSHLSQVMAKTGTARQAQLVALLKSAGRLGSLT